MTKSRIGRRHFLRGSGGVALALPLLPSLFPLREADALAAAPAPKRFVFVSRLYGTVERGRMYPSDSTLTDSAPICAGGHTVQWGKLVRTVNGANASLSAALTAPADLFSASIVSKMNVLRGLDIPIDINHQTGAFLGNFLANNQGGGGVPDNVALNGYGNQPTIDQIMAYSPSFYPNGVRERFILEGHQYTAPGPYSFYYSNTQSKSGGVSAVASNRSSSYWFDKLFAGVTPGANPASPAPAASGRTPLVDRVLEDYKSLRAGNKRLSAGDRTRLDEFVGRIAELQKKIQSVPSTTAAPAACKPQKNSVDTGSFSAVENGIARSTQKYAIWSELVAMAFACDVTRIAILPAGEVFGDINGDYHNDYSHNPQGAGRQDVIVQTHANQLRLCVLPIVTKLELAEANGKTILDNSLVMWVHEHGAEPHYTLGLPVVTFGSAGGYFKTGTYFDFRRKGGPTTGISGSEPTGITYQRWLATVLQSMGVPKSEWEKPGRPGYGVNMIGSLFQGKYLQPVIDTASSPPPMMLA